MKPKINPRNIRPQIRGVSKLARELGLSANHVGLVIRGKRESPHVLAAAIEAGIVLPSTGEKNE